MNTKLVELIKNKKQDIITTIKMVARDSVIPDFFGNYDIYIDESDGQLYVYQTISETFRPADSHLHFLYSIKSHAPRTATEQVNVEEVIKEIVHADDTFEIIVATYETITD